MLLGTLLYFVSPIDIAPDMFPVIGWIDDGLVATICHHRSYPNADGAETAFAKHRKKLQLLKTPAGPPRVTPAKPLLM